MALSVLIAPDKFKGTLTAPQAAKAIARGWRVARPQDRLTLLPISDGGDGFGPLLARLMKAQRRRDSTKNPHGRFTGFHWWLSTATDTAIIESAEIIGLAKLQQNSARNPLRVNTAGLGFALACLHPPVKRRRKFPKHAIVGLGGSATNDGGFGMARELGWYFWDATGLEIKRWPDLVSLEKITEPNPEENWAGKLDSITLAVDVQNPLLGPNGCTRVYGPQKGLKEKDMPKAEAALTRLAVVWEAQTGEDAAGLPGAGAGGGLGFGLHCFAGAEIRPGFEIFAEAAKLTTLLKKADLVITGEGAMDRQTVMGKGVGELAKLALDHDCLCIGLAGQLKNATILRRQLLLCDALTRLTTAEDAQAKPGHWLAKLAKETAQRVLAEGPSFKFI